MLFYVPWTLCCGISWWVGYTLLVKGGRHEIAHIQAGFWKTLRGTVW